MAMLRAPGTRPVFVGLLFSSAVWGTQFALAKLLVSAAPPTTLAFARSCVAAACFIGLAVTLPGRLSVGRKDIGRVSLFAMLGSVIYQGCFFAGLQFASATDGALLLPTTNPIFTVVLARLFGHEAPTRRQLAGMLVSVLGVGLVFEAATSDERAAPTRVLGDVLFLVSSFAWACQSVLGRHLFRTYGAVRTLAVASAMGILPLALLSTALGDNTSLVRLDAGQWALIALLGTTSAFLAFLLFNQAVAVIGASAAARFNNLIPVWGIAAAVPLLGERPLPIELLGGGLIVFGVSVSTSAGVWRLRRPGLRPRPAR